MFSMSSAVSLATTGFMRSGPNAFTRTHLHIVKLAHNVAWRPAGKSRNGTESFQTGAVTHCALSRFAGACSDEGFTFLNAAGRNIGNESGVRITQSFGVLAFPGLR